MNLPLELDFLHDHLVDSEEFYRTAEWLLSPFDSLVWEYSFDFKSPNRLDWHVELSDGSYLTDPKNSALLNSLKYWLIACTTPQDKKGITNSVKGQYNAFNRTLHLIDYLLLNDDHLRLHKYSLGGLSEDDLKAALTQVTSSSEITESLFDWSNKLVEFTMKLLSESDQLEIERCLDAFSSAHNITADDEDEARSFGIAPETIPKLRAALRVNGFIIQNRRLGRAPNSIKISQLIYPRSIRVRTIDKPALSFLCYFDSVEGHSREFEKVPVTTGLRQSLSLAAFSSYRRSFYNLGVLHELKLPAPTLETLISINNFGIALEQQGRFRTLPSALVFDAVKDAIEFHFKYARDLMNGYLKLAIEAKKRDCLIKDVPRDAFSKAIGPNLEALGVRYYTLTQMQNRQNLKPPKDLYFNAFRGNQGLLELICCYFGATQIVVGALTARRGGELQELKIGEALDNSGRWIVFNNRKSTRSLMGLRTAEARPIEPVAVKMLRELERFQRVLNRIGFGNYVYSIFSPPTTRGENYRVNPDSYIFNKNLDLFCDYFETSLNSIGQRYYIRQHQLRRFFALLFFYTNTFGGLETLQWMLGHTDLSHVWHYITETIGGDVLRGAKSQYVAEELHRNGLENYKELSGLLSSRYGTTDFTLVDTEELEDYLAELLEDGEIEIEPEFFTDADGEKFRVVVRVRDLGDDTV